MIKDATEQFNPLGSGTIIGAVINDQDGLSLFTGKPIKNIKESAPKTQQQSAPIKAGTPEQLVGGIFAECNIFIDDNATKEVLSDKGQCENDLCQTGVSEIICNEGRKPAPGAVSGIGLL